MAQAKGAKARVVLGFESVFGQAPSPAAGYVMPVNSCSLKSERNLNASQTLTGSRNPVEPFDGNVKVSGDVSIPVDGRATLIWLRSMFGTPTTSAVAAKTLNNAAVTDEGSGKVGLPCTAHGFALGSQVLVAGTDHYDAVYTVQSGTSANKIVVAATYQAESLAGTETVRACVRVVLSAGAVTNEGSGKVGFPAASHGLPVGAEIVVAGTSNYDGTYAVARGTTASKIVVAASYQAETLLGDETATAYFHDQAFKIGDTMPSLTVEKGFLDIGQYALHGGCRPSKLSMSLGGDGELTATVGLEGASEALSSSVWDSSPVALALARFQNFQASVSEGGSAVTIAKSASLDIDFGLDPDQYLLGSGGVRGDLPEGVCAVSGRLSTLFTDRALLDKAVASTTSSLSMVLTSTNSHHRLTFDMHEIKFGRNTPGIDGPRGILVDLPWQAFHASHADGSAVVVTLRTEIKTFA